MGSASVINGPPRPTAPRRAILALILLTVVARGGTLWFAAGSLADDPDGYRLLARSLVESSGKDFHDELNRRAYRPPLYPLLLAGTGGHRPKATATIALVHLLLGIATVCLTERLGRRWGLGNFSLLAAALVACDPILLNQSTLVMTETLATFLAILGLHVLTTAAQRPTVTNMALAAASVGLAALCRPIFLAVALLALPLLTTMLTSVRYRLLGAAAFVVTLATVLSPWMLWTYSQLGVPLATTTHGGYTLLLGNNPRFYESLRTARWGEIWDAGEFQQEWQAVADDIRASEATLPAAEVREDRAAYYQAWRNIRREPTMFLTSCLVRCGRFWGPLPHQIDEQESTLRRLARWGVAVWYVAQFALAICGIWTLRSRLLKSPWLWGVLLVATFSAVHVVYWSNLRMRVPVTPVVALLAAAGAARLASRGEST